MITQPLEYQYTPAIVSYDADLTENYMYISTKFRTGVHVFSWEVGVFNRLCFQSVSCNDRELSMTSEKIAKLKQHTATDEQLQRLADTAPSCLKLNAELAKFWNLNAKFCHLFVILFSKATELAKFWKIVKLLSKTRKREFVIKFC